MHFLFLVHKCKDIADQAICCKSDDKAPIRQRNFFFVFVFVGVFVFVFVFVLVLFPGLVSQALCRKSDDEGDYAGCAHWPQLRSAFLLSVYTTPGPCVLLP